MNRVMGGTVGLPSPRSDWNQTNPNKADYIKNKPIVVVTIPLNSPTFTESDELNDLTEKKLYRLQHDSGLCGWLFCSLRGGALPSECDQLLIDCDNNIYRRKSTRVDEDKYEWTAWERFATLEDVKSEINKIVDGSPEALDALYELAEALGNDENFSTTVLEEIGKKADAELVEAQLNAILYGEHNPDYNIPRICVHQAEHDAMGNVIHETYVTKEDITNISGIENPIKTLTIGAYASQDAFRFDIRLEDLSTISQVGMYKLTYSNYEQYAWLFVGCGNSPNNDITQTIIDVDGKICCRHLYSDASTGMQWSEWQDIGGNSGSIVVDTELDAFSDNPIANSTITRFVETQLPSKTDVDAFADGDRIAKKAECDKNGNQIDTTYATNKNVGELVENISKVLEDTERTINKMYLIPDETEHDYVWYPSNGAVREYVTAQIGDVETSLDNIIKKYDLGGDSV